MADEKDKAAEKQGGGRKKLVIVALVAIVLLLSAGAAAYLLLGGDADGDGQAEVPAVEEGDPVYHKLDPEFIVTLPPGGPVGMLQVAIEVMSRSPGVPETLAANDPMIRHHLLNLLEAQQATDLLTVEGKEALQAAIHELLSERLKALGEPGEIKGVFFTQFVMQ